MSTRITAENGAGFEVGQLGITVVHPEGIATIYARLTDAQRVELAAALDPGRRGLHVRLDNQAKTLATLQRERDAAVARAEAAEKRHTWPKVTPTGHTYVEPRTYEALRHEHDNAAQAEVECWAADECPPEPTWEMVGSAHREVERLQCERDEWKARAEAAEAPTAPAVTRKLVYDAVGAVYDVNGHRGPWPGVEPITDAVCHLFGIETDPDPVETLAMQIEAATRKAVRQACESLSSVTTGLGPEVIEEMMDITEASRRLARHVLGQKASDE